MPNQPDDTSESWIGALGRVAWYAALAVMPTTVACIALWLLLGATVFDYRPVEADEFIYWRSVAMVEAHGLNGGFIAFEDAVPEYEIAHLGFWGPVYPLALGSVARIVGWSAYSPPIFSMVFISALTFLSMVAGRLSLRRASVLALLIVAFPPTLIYVVSGMQEALHYGFALSLATLAARALQASVGSNLGAHRVNWWAAGFFGTVIIASLIRPVWAPLAIPALLMLAPSSWKGRVVAVLGGLGVAGVLTALFGAWGAPVSNPGFGATYALEQASTVREKASVLWDNGQSNLGYLWGWHIPASGFDIAPYMGWAILLSWSVVTVYLIGVLVRVTRRKTRAGEFMSGVVLATGFVGPIVVLIAMYVFAFPQGTRTSFPPLLFAVAFILISRSTSRILVVLPISVIGLGVAMCVVTAHDIRFRSGVNYAIARDDVTDGASSAVNEQIDGTLSDTSGRWCRTVLISTAGANDGLFPWQLREVDSQIGFSINLMSEPPQPIRSGFVIADPWRNASFVELGLKRVASIEGVGVLYRNPKTVC